MKLQILRRKRNPANIDWQRQQLLMQFNRGLLVVIILLNGEFSVRAQLPVSDTSANNLDQVVTKAKLGARFAIGGVFGYGADHVRHLKDIRPKYGARVSLLIPFGAKGDITAVVEYVSFPGYAYVGPNYTTSKTFDVLNSQLGAFRIGARWYARKKKLDPLVSSMGWGIRRMLWRERVDRSGFHAGISMGPELGWHKRITHAIPENWPVNDQITESEMEHNVLDYTRWYWRGCIELGWTFSGKIDFTLSIDAAGRIQEYDKRSSRVFELASDAYSQRTYLTGSLSFIVGRNCIK